jgi:hypothetical protein
MNSISCLYDSNAPYMLSRCILKSQDDLYHDFLAEMTFKVYRKPSDDVTPVDILEALN